MKKLLTLAVVAVAMAFASSKALALSHTYPNVPLNINATVQYSTEVMTTNGTKVTSAPIQTVTFNNKSIISEIALLQKTNLPADAYLAWNPWDEEIYVTNSTGLSYYPDFDLDVYDDSLTGQATQNLKTSAGSEKDLTAVYIYMDFDSTNYIETYNALGTLNWTYGAATGSNQVATLNLSMSFSGSDGSEINGYQAEITSGKITGKGSGTEPADLFPFYYNY